MNNSWNKTEKKQITIFSIIAFGLPVVMGIIMGVSFYAGNDVSVFPITHMFYPAAGVILALWLTKTGEEMIPKKFYIGYLLTTAVMLILTVASVVAPSAIWMVYANYAAMIGSVVCFILILLEKKEVRIRYKIGITGKPKSKAWLYIILFFLLYMARIIVSYFIEGMGNEVKVIFTNPQTWLLILVIIINFFFSYIIFFGEEYGWRFFFQPMLQKRFGQKTGVIILGILWGLWHLPINLFYYSPETAIQSIISQQITCISLSIFMAWAYMKTQNIWVPVLMHFINNNMAVVWGGGSMNFDNQILAWSDIGILLLLNLIAFCPFIFSKEFSKFVQKKSFIVDNVTETDGISEESKQ